MRLTAALFELTLVARYNAASLDEWLGYYDGIVNSQVPRDAVAIGLGMNGVTQYILCKSRHQGCYVDSSTNGTWSADPVSATERVNQAMQDSIPELAMFRLVPITGM